jgi:hypothetical protein
MKNILWLLLVVTNISLAQDSLGDFPKGPMAKLTPGELCDRPSSYRYPENIAYCERNVTVEQKSQIFAAYRAIGYRLNLSDRSSYKIDHYLPLCAGGSNNNENLWPQHVSVGVLTDDLEQLGCDKMAKGKITQAKFVLLIKRAKNDLSQASAVRSELSRL